MPLAMEVIDPVVVNVVQEEQNRPKSGRRARKRFLSQKWWYCLLFQLFAVISPKFIFRVELEILLGKRRTLSWQVTRGDPQSGQYWP